MAGPPPGSPRLSAESAFAKDTGLVLTYMITDVCAWEGCWLKAEEYKSIPVRGKDS